MSLTDEQINLLQFASQQTPLFINSIDTSTGQSISSSVVTTTQSITASVPHQPQLNATINMSQNLTEKSKNALEVDYCFLNIYLNNVFF
jgi:hypothetical protein